MVVDELALIAQARATMLIRDYAPLRLEIGRASFDRMVYWSGGAVLDPTERETPVILGMQTTVRDDMEGFAVLPG